MNLQVLNFQLTMGFESYVALLFGEVGFRRNDRRAFPPSFSLCHFAKSPSLGNIREREIDTKIYYLMIICVAEIKIKDQGGDGVEVTDNGRGIDHENFQTASTTSPPHHLTAFIPRFSFEFISTFSFTTLHFKIAVLH